MKATSEIARSAVLSYCSSVLNILIGVLYTPWLIKSLGTSDYGLYALATTFVAYFLIDFGLGNSVSKYLSEYRVKNKQQDISNFLGIVCKTYFIICAVLALIFAIIYFNIEQIFQGLTAEEVGKFRIVFIIVALYSTLSFPFNIYNGILTAYEKFTPIQKANIIQKSVLVIFMSGALLLGFGVFALVLLYAFSGICAIIYKSFYVAKCDLKINWKYINGSFIIQILKFSMWVCVVGICIQLIYGLPTTILGIVSDTKNISFYSISHTIYGFVYLFASALDNVFMPKVSYIENEQYKTERINQLMIKVGRCQLLIVGLIVSGFAIFGRLFLTLWMGEEFSVAYYITLLLILPTIVVLTEGIGTVLLYVRERIKYKAVIYLIASVFCSILSFLLSPSMGAVGAALAVCLSIVIFDTIGLNIVYGKKFGIRILDFFYNCHIKYLIPLAIALFVGFEIQLIDCPDTWFVFVSKLSAYIIVYIILVWVLFMNEEEKKLVKGFLKK